MTLHHPPCPMARHIALPRRAALLLCDRPLTIVIRHLTTRIALANVVLAFGVTQSTRRMMPLLVRSLPYWFTFECFLRIECSSFRFPFPKAQNPRW